MSMLTLKPTPVQLRRRSTSGGIILLVIVITVIGFAVRLYQAITSDFPLADGGLFTVMIGDLLENGLRIPAFTTYNGGAFPFAYPPLMFMFAALLQRLTNAPTLDIVCLLPTLLHTLTIPAVYLLARALNPDPKKLRAAVFAALAFALMPGAWLWTLGGGGLTRSGGLFFAALTLWVGAHLFRSRRGVLVIPTAVFFGLAVLSHPQMGYLAAYSLLLFMLFLDRSRAGVVRWITACVIAAVVSAPWWAVVITTHGLPTLVNAFGTGIIGARFANLAVLPLGLGGVEPSFWGFLALLGLVQCLAERHFLIAAWLAAVFFMDTRLPVVPVSLAVALLAGSFIEGALLTGLVEVQTRRRTRHRALMVGLLLLIVVGSGLIAALSIGLSSLSADHRNAMRWISENTSAKSRFLVLAHAPGERWYEGADAVSEWFPALSGRQSVATVQGREWLPAFPETVARYETLLNCGGAPEGIECLEAWARASTADFDSIYIDTRRVEPFRLRETALRTGRYTIPYEALGVLVLTRSADR